jgi:hypothetical protein
MGNNWRLESLWGKRFCVLWLATLPATGLGANIKCETQRLSTLHSNNVVSKKR